MKFVDLMRAVGDEPLFETSLLLVGDVAPATVSRQLSRWTKAGKIFQIRRGLYALAEPWRKADPHPFVVANHLSPGSYVSLQSALAHHGFIPEFVPVTTSVGPVRTRRWDSELGSYLFRHLEDRYVGGYAEVELPDGQRAWIATPEKALVDLVHLVAGADDEAYLRELRLEELDRLDLRAFRRWAEDLDRPKLRRASDALERIVDEASHGRHREAA